MFNTDSINFIEFRLLEGQVDLVLEALQLYAFNFHKVWAIDKDSDREDLRNSLIFHTYNEILSKYNNTKINYDVISACRLENRRKRVTQYKKSKKIA